MPLTEGCTAETLYNRLEELGEDIDRLRRSHPSFATLRKLYFDSVNKKLSQRVHFPRRVERRERTRYRADSSRTGLVN